MGRLTTVGIAALSAALVTGVLSSAEDAPASAETKRAPGPVIVPGSLPGTRCSMAPPPESLSTTAGTRSRRPGSRAADRCQRHE